MTRSFTLLLILLAVALIVGWIPIPTGNEPKDSDLTKLVDSAGSNSSPTSPGLALTGFNPPAEPPQASSRTESIPDNAGFPVSVIDHETKQPLDGVSVYTASMSELERSRLAPPKDCLDRNTIDFIQRVGIRVQTGPDGQAVVPELEPAQLIYAGSNGKEDLQYRGHLSKVELALEERNYLKVLVLDSDQNRVPQFPVALQRRSSQSMKTEWIVWTNSIGVATFHSPSFYFPEPGWSGVLCVAAAVQGASAHAHPQAWHLIRDHDDLNSTITLVKPPTGSVWVQVTASQAASSSAEYDPEVYLHFQAPEDPPLIEHSWKTMNSTADASGKVRFVGLGSQVFAGYQDKELRFPGPSNAGELVHKVIEHVERITWTGKLIGPDGSPPGAGTLRILDQKVSETDQQSYTNRGKVSGDGSFEVPVYPSKLEGESARHCLGLVYQRSEDDELYCAQIELSPGFSSELGIVQLITLPTTITGTIRDQNGNPLPEADLSQTSNLHSSHHPGSLMILDAESVDVDKNGEFAVHFSGPHDTTYSITAYADGYLDQTRFARIGEPLNFVMEKEPSKDCLVTGSISFGSNVFSTDIKGTYQVSGQSYRTHLKMDRRENGNRSFQIRAFRNDEINVRVETLIGEEIFQSDQLNFKDSQLLDLGEVANLQKLRMPIVIKVNDEVGLPLPAKLVVSTDGHQGTIGAHNGTRRLRTLNPIQKLVVTANGFLPQELAVPNASQTVVLRRKPN